ncbi:membrane protein [Pasteurella multocida]|nr:membrane protein [Pasteurella multocida]
MKNVFLLKHRRKMRLWILPLNANFMARCILKKDEPVIEDRFVEQTFEHIVQPRSRWWKTGLALTALLFCFAVIAQSIQWLVDTWQQNQWIYFVFSLVTCLVVLLGVSSLGKEWLRLVKLKKKTFITAKKPTNIARKCGQFRARFLC